MFSTINRRRLVATSAVSASALAISPLVFAEEATPTDDHDHDHDDHDHEGDHDHDHAEGTDVYLLVADAEAQTLSAYATEDNSLVGTLDGIAMNAHAGIINLPNGTALIVDDAAGRLLNIGVHEGEFEILGEAPVPGTVAHFAIESDHAHHCAVGTSGEDEYQLHLVDLEDWSVVSLHLPDAGEVGLMMTHDVLFHRNSNLNQVEAYSLATLAEGTVEPLSTLPIGTFGHGEAINPETEELFMLTDDGVDVAYWEDPELVYGKTFAWPSSRGYFTRLIQDGKYLLTYTSDRSAPETEWHTWQNNVVIYDVATGEPIVTPLPDGYVFRYSLAENLAVFASINADGDTLIAIDLDPESDAFGGITATTPLETMSTGAAAGEPFFEIGQYRTTALLPDASVAFVSRGGDGIVDICHPDHGEVVGSIDTETALNGGGTLAVFGPGVPLTDMIGR
ncbi:MAG: hypothetical protein M9934_13635 [Thermomicrobiales bacterium]|nr:hypothetical protein [Thermomicrobiales bacterium]MCO5229305.1 hypothetical protein [Thermomicrobiales bacterium]